MRLPVLDALLYASESLILIYIASKVLSKRFSYILMFFFLIVFQVVKAFLGMAGPYSSVLCFTADILAIVMCFKGGIGKKLYTAVLFYASLSISDLSAYMIALYTYRIFNEAIASDEVLYYPSSLTSKILALFMIMLFRKISNTEERAREWMTFLPIPAVTVIVFTWIFPYARENTDTYYLLALICFFGLLSNAVLFGLIQMSAEKKKLQYRLSVSEELKDWEAVYFYDLRVSYQKLERAVHDMKHHIEYIRCAHDLETVVRYANELVERDFSVMKPFTGNIDIDTILNARYHEMLEKNISLNVNVLLPERIDWLDPVDMSIILGNGLSNAIEACERCNGKEITVQFTYEDWLIISIENPTDSKPVKKEYGYLSAKGEGHGIGIMCMEAAVTRYDGHIEYTVENNVFRLDIMLQQCRNKDV